MTDTSEMKFKVRNANGSFHICFLLPCSSSTSRACVGQTPIPRWGRLILQTSTQAHDHNLLQTDSKKELNIVFEFYEKLAVCEDEEVKNLLQVTLLENLMDNKELYKKAEKYMRTNTKSICKLIEQYLK